MEDGLAREGVLALCNRDRDGTIDDVECANARRAAAALAIDAERAREGTLERQSERKLAALREAQARESAGPAEGAAGSGATFGSPIGAVMPSMTESSLFEVYAAGTEPLGRPSLEVATAEPPANEIEIVAPQIELAEVAVIPRPFRDGDATAPR